MVWPVQNNRSDSRRDSGTEEWEAGDSQVERGRLDEHGTSFRSDEHSNADSVQERGASDTNSGSQTQRTTTSGPGTPPIDPQIIDFDGYSLDNLPGEHDLNLRLVELGFELDGNNLANRILAFQKSRALPQTGICDVLTWKSLLEASYHLGDRLLYVHTPMMRGEDVADLQNRLGALGFDAGRVDGIFGPETLTALKDFQRNVGLPIDGICGPTTIEELRRVFGRSATNIHSVKELEDFRSQTRSLSELNIAITHQGFMDAPAEILRFALALKGARAQVIMHPDPSKLAGFSNSQKADACIHLEEQRGKQEIRFYEGFSYSSASGKVLAKLIAEHMNAPQCGLDIEVVGRNVPMLRETTMTAVTISMQDASFWVLHSAKTALAIATAISEWTSRDFRHYL